MRILVTGTRAPASMDIIRTLLAQGHEVYSADSLKFAIGRFVKGLNHHFTLPKPNRDLEGFIAGLKVILIEQTIDLLIPTCEEIFFISQAFEELSQHCRLLCEPFERLNQLHNKFSFNQLAHEYGLDAPESVLLKDTKDKSLLPPSLPLVLKPVYSRFGAHVLIKPSAQTLANLLIKVPYIAQRFISGKEYCSYAIADKGEVLIHSTYHPKYTAGPAAGIYFEPADIVPINHFIKEFCQQFKFSGQIAFDFIVENDKAFVLECNPRSTSGFHLLAQHIEWNKIFKGEQHTHKVCSQPFMIALGMKVHGLGYIKKNTTEFLSDYIKAKDVLSAKAYPWLGIKSMLTLGNIWLRMFKEKKNFHLASTDDIEFNGVQ